MPRMDEKARNLANEGPEMATALEVVLDRAEDKGEIEWSDVSDDLTSGQWGRLIEKGLLVEGHNDGFVVNNPDGVRDALQESDVEAEDDDEDGGWSTWDKLAGLATLGLMAGYSLTSIRDAIGGTIDIALGPLAAILPFYIMIMVLAVFNGTTSSILQDQLMDMDGMQDSQEQIKDIQNRLEDAKERGDDEAVERIEQEQMEAMTEQMGSMFAMFRPMVWIMLINIPIFLWLYWMVYGGALDVSSTAVTMPIFGSVSSWNEGVAGPMQAWIVWYFLCTLSFTQIIRKALNVETSPTTS